MPEKTLNSEFKDHFSTDSKSYRRCRPGYPLTLFRYLASVTRAHACAWDCATGTGQAAVSLANHYSQVTATDLSREQITRARWHAGVTYKVAPAEASTLPDNSVDLITVAQALHWFDIPDFSREVVRVLKPGGALAVWTYDLLHVSPDIDKVIDELYSDILAGYWPDERKMVESGYQGVDFPLKQIQPPLILMKESWDLRRLTCYLSTWSAVKQFQKLQGVDPLLLSQGRLEAAWGNPDKVRLIAWPLTLKVWINEP